MYRAVVCIVSIMEGRLNIEELIKDNYEIAKSKGFYPDDSKIEDHLMGIVSEIGEAYEAHRGGKFADWERFDRGLKYWGLTKVMKLSDKDLMIDSYKNHISGTFEDELADVFIRLFNFLGHYKLQIEDMHFENIGSCTDITSFFLVFCGKLSRIASLEYKEYWLNITRTIYSIMRMTYNLCNGLNIPIEKHIQAKMEYNKTRPHLHGKEY